MKNKDNLLYPRTKKFSRYIGVRGHIRAINLANLNFREYKNQAGKLQQKQPVTKRKELLV